MARNKLSETKIKSLKVGIHSDGDGLYLRVFKGGSKSWIFIYKRKGVRTELGLGGYGQGTAPVSLALAREKAEAIRQRLARGEELDSKKTFLDIMDDVLNVKQASFRNEKHMLQHLKNAMQALRSGAFMPAILLNHMTAFWSTTRSITAALIYRARNRAGQPIAVNLKARRCSRLWPIP